MKYIDYTTGYLCVCSANPTALAQVQSPRIPLLCIGGILEILGSIPQGAFKIRLTDKATIRENLVWIGMVKTEIRGKSLYRWGRNRNCMGASLTKAAEKVVAKLGIKNPRQLSIEYVLP